MQPGRCSVSPGTENGRILLSLFWKTYYVAQERQGGEGVAGTSVPGLWNMQWMRAELAAEKADSAALLSWNPDCGPCGFPGGNAQSALPPGKVRMWSLST